MDDTLPNAQMSADLTGIYIVFELELKFANHSITFPIYPCTMFSSHDCKTWTSEIMVEEYDKLLRFITGVDVAYTSCYAEGDDTPKSMVHITENDVKIQTEYCNVTLDKAVQPKIIEAFKWQYDNLQRLVDEFNGRA